MCGRGGVWRVAYGRGGVWEGVVYGRVVYGRGWCMGGGGVWEGVLS